MNHLAIALVICASLAACQAQAADSKLPARKSVPNDGVIRLTDYGFRDWGPELVHYTVDTKAFKPGEVVLRDEAGAEVPCQIDGDVL